MARHDVEAFQFPAGEDEDHRAEPALWESVEQLRSEGRHRDALDEVIADLRRNGRSAGAFSLALDLCYGYTGRSEPEAVTIEQLASPYLAPVANECAGCLKFWYSTHVLIANRRVAVANPRGVQCQVCRYTLCRDCMPTEDLSCPEPGCAGALGTPVLPTGRPRGMPTNPHTDRVEWVLIMWHNDGPGRRRGWWRQRHARPGVLPVEEIRQLLDLVCTWQDIRNARVTTVESPNLDRMLGEALVMRYEGEGVVSPGALERCRTELVQSPGRGRRRLFVVSAPQ